MYKMAFLSSPTLQIQFWMLLCVILIFVPVSCTSYIEIDSDGGYSKIVVAVSDRVTGKQHNWNLDKLTQTFEEFFSLASQHLYKFTRNRTFFSEIQVLVPHTWDKFSTKLGNATYESYLEADIRFDVFNPSPGWGDLYTRQRRRCGEKGDYIYLDSKFLLQWEEKKGPKYVERFVQEWTKLRCGIPKNAAQNNSLCGFRSVWDVIESSEDLKSVINVTQQMSIDKLKPTINFVKSSMDVLIVINPSVLATIESKKILIHTLKKFIGNFPDNGRVGYYMPNSGQTMIKGMLKREPIDSHLHFIDRIMKWEYTDTIRSFLNTITDVLPKIVSPSASFHYHLVVITNEPEIRYSLFSTVESSTVNFFLLTITINGSKIASYKPRNTRIFLDQSPQILWVDVKATSSVDNCNYTPAKYIDNALVQFFTKFGNEDFYPNKIKIRDYSLAIDEKGRFILPSTGASITFNVYSCFQNDGSVSLTIYVDDSAVREVSGSISDYSYSYVWTHSYAKGRAISFKTTISMSNFVEAVVWVDHINKSYTKTVLDARIDTGPEIQNNHKKPFVIYAYNPNMYVLTAEILSYNGKKLTLDLMDDGNEGGDLWSGDYIYSQYIIDTSAYGDQSLSIKINARDNDGNNVIQLDYGWVWLHADELREFSPRRINNFKLEQIDEDSSHAHFSWSAPNTYDNQVLAEGSKTLLVSVNAYYLVCNSNANNLSAESVETAMNKYKINLLPKKPGEMEYYTWKIPSLNTAYYCIMLSTNEKKLSSESSNVVAIFFEPTTPTPESTTPTPESTTPDSDNFSVLAIAGITVGCCVLILIIAMIFCICKRRRNSSKQKVRSKRTDVSSDAKKIRQLIDQYPTTKPIGSSKEYIPLNVISANCVYSNSSIGEPMGTYDDSSSPYSDEITQVQEDGYQIGNINNIPPLEDGYIQP